LAIALHGLVEPPLVKAATLTGAAAIMAYALSALMFRRLPLLRNIL